VITSGVGAGGRPLRKASGSRVSDNDRVAPVFAMSHHTGARLAEVGFLLILFAGIRLAAPVPRLRLGTGRTTVAGIALATAGVLLIIATHWGHFG